MVKGGGMWSWCPRLRVPVARKCCFCVPVRIGVIIFGYVNLTVWLLMFPMLVYLVTRAATRDGEGGAGREEGAGSRLQLPLTAAAVLADAAITTVLLLAAHQKRRSVLVACVWCGAGVQAAMLALDLAFLDHRHPMLSALFLVFLGVNVYLLWLVWSLSVRLSEACPAHPAPAPAQPPPAHHPQPPAASRSREWRYVMHLARHEPPRPHDELHPQYPHHSA